MNFQTVLFLIVLQLFLLTAEAKDIYDIPDIQPITNQLYPSGNELELKVTYFPIGAFNKYVGVAGSYLKMFDEISGWEVSGYYFIENQAPLKKTVIEHYGAKEEEFAVLKYLIKTGYTYVPFYSKSILFNSSLIHSRTYLNVSAGMADYQVEKPVFLSAGYGINFYSGQNQGIKFELDFFHFFKKNGYIQDQLSVSLGWVVTWGDR